MAEGAASPPRHSLLPILHAPLFTSHSPLSILHSQLCVHDKANSPLSTRNFAFITRQTINPNKQLHDARQQTAHYLALLARTLFSTTQENRDSL